MRRRTLLAAGVGLLGSLAGCTTGDEEPVGLTIDSATAYAVTETRLVALVDVRKGADRDASFGIRWDVSDGEYIQTVTGHFDSPATRHHDADVPGIRVALQMAHATTIEPGDVTESRLKLVREGADGPWRDVPVRAPRPA
ncbi:hypothetical protein MBEHAL_2422 [Halarchaeum acidiphilum MH1-52-1]|uniref:Uncharacterized protein n=1 Tax=Halarchaeum acidiphilum MH1-52-1 TaxID=1261545 RepID=U2YXX4_9EURY|nr:hypothetical protein [Halarchaeum acidiphilum]GAD53662.1 hypothetical protein MBEHAL_2422 [Halarchaeum acidiphilum MH1-52-1]